MRCLLLLIPAALASVIRGSGADTNGGCMHHHEAREGPLQKRQGPHGESTANIARPRAGNVPYGTLITTCTRPGTIALTFDDGPYIYTAHVLDLLQQYGAKATFFIVGNSMGGTTMDDESGPWPAVLRRMHAAGHQLASHTWSHADLEWAGDAERSQQLVWNEMGFRNVFGWFPRYMRPPYASCSAGSGCLAAAGRLGYHVVNFDIDTKDYEHDSPAAIQWSKDVFAGAVSFDAASSSYIELSHDTHEQTAYNLTEFMLRTARDRGYRAVTVGECLGDPKANWYLHV